MTPAKHAPAICVSELAKQSLFQIRQADSPDSIEERKAIKKELVKNCVTAKKPSAEIKSAIVLDL